LQRLLAGWVNHEVVSHVPEERSRPYQLYQALEALETTRER
jgi:hypothetical protein